jgi:transposase
MAKSNSIFASSTTCSGAKKRSWKSDAVELEICRAYEKEGSIRAAARELGCTATTVARVLQRRGVRDTAAAPPPTPRKTRATISLMYAEGVSQTEISKRLGVSEDRVSGVLMSQGVKERRRIPGFNVNAFAPSSRGYSSEQKYWAGLLLADGCLSLTDGKTPVLSLTLTDREHIWKFRSFLKSRNKISAHTPKNNRNPKGDILKAKTNYRLSACGDRISRDVQALGISPNKTYSSKLPDFLKRDRDYWRGMMDGDGHLSHLPRRDTGKIRSQIGICGTKEICTSFSELVVHVAGGCTIKPIHDKRCFDNFFSISVSGERAALVAAWLYDGANTYLERKMSKALQIMWHYGIGEKNSMQLSLLAV